MHTRSLIFTCLFFLFTKSILASDSPTSRLFEAIKNGSELEFKDALKDGADLNFVSEDGLAPLDLSIIRHRFSFTRMLHESGANILQIGQDGLTAFERALRNNISADIANYLSSILLQIYHDPSEERERFFFELSLWAVQEKDAERIVSQLLSTPYLTEAGWLPHVLRAAIECHRLDLLPIIIDGELPPESGFFSRYLPFFQSSREKNRRNWKEASVEQISYIMERALSVLDEREMSLFFDSIKNQKWFSNFLEYFFYAQLTDQKKLISDDDIFKKFIFILNKEGIPFPEFKQSHYIRSGDNLLVKFTKEKRDKLLYLLNYKLLSFSKRIPYSTLLWAVDNEDKVLLEALRQNKLDINLPIFSMYITPVFYAIENRRFEIARYLIEECGASLLPAIKEIHGSRLDIWYAVKDLDEKDRDFVIYLLEACQKQDSLFFFEEGIFGVWKNTFLESMLQWYQPKYDYIIEEVLKYGADPSYVLKAIRRNALNRSSVNLFSKVPQHIIQILEEYEVENHFKNIFFEPFDSLDLTAEEASQVTGLHRQFMVGAMPYALVVELLLFMFPSHEDYMFSFFSITQ